MNIGLLIIVIWAGIMSQAGLVAVGVLAGRAGLVRKLLDAANRAIDEDDAE